ncbi:winged helix-turn-helix domain-containing protein [Micromonospora sp. NPDC050397]|uniref:winged helix-turn-helix domain-containing protein n=1 Tax=Micromonospora sp. NPDC050397 TaxID=3364279 RepID=UPI00384A8203
MSVIAISPRAYPSPSGSLRSTLARRRAAPEHAPATLTVTVDITLDTGDALTPQATRLLELVRELVAQGDRDVSVVGPAGGPSVLGSESAGDLAGVPGEFTGDVGEGGGGQAAGIAGPLRILAGSRTVLRDRRSIPLTRLEYDLLFFLAEHPRRVFTRLQLLNSVWGYEHAVARTVDVHVRRLRAKLGETLPVVTTVYGVGYRLADEARISIDRNA